MESFMQGYLASVQTAAEAARLAAAQEMQMHREQMAAQAQQTNMMMMALLGPARRVGAIDGVVLSGPAAAPPAPATWAPRPHVLREAAPVENEDEEAKDNQGAQ